MSEIYVYMILMQFFGPGLQVLGGGEGVHLWLSQSAMPDTDGEFVQVE